MSRLDRHVNSVRARMTMSVWLRALAWAGILYAIVVWAALVVDRLVRMRLPREHVWFWAGVGATLAVSLAYTIWRRPSRQQAAVAIDDRLQLKEKISTALYVRSINDPFAIETVRDAERTADKVSLGKQFPVKVPQAAGGTVLAVIAVFLTAWLLPTFDLFGVQARQAARTQAEILTQQQARDAVHRAIAQIDSAPRSVQQSMDMKIAKRDLEDLLKRPSLDPDRAKSTAEKAVQNVQQAIKNKIQENKEFAVTQQEMKDFKDLAPPADDAGPVAQAHRDLTQGKLDDAVTNLEKAVNNFDKMDRKEQEKATGQMKNLADALQKMAQDPKTEEQVKKQLQQSGASQQQAQQIANLMKQAAAGDKQAQQQIAQAAKQLAQQMNQNSNGSSQQQRQNAQQVQKLMQQMQQQINAQINAQQLAQNAQALAQAMQQPGQGGNAGQPKQGQQAQMANKNAQGQQGQKGNNAQQMAAAAKQMQQQLQQMQAVANDAQQVAAAQKNAAGQDAAGGGQNPGQDGNNGPNQQQANAGQWGKPNGQQHNQVGQQAGPQGGPAVGGRPPPEVAPFSVKDETDTFQKDEKGRILAKTMVKGDSLKGDAKMEVRKVIPSVDKEATDEVDEQRVSRQDEGVVRDYFSTLKKDAEK